MEVLETKLCILFALLGSCLTAALIPFLCFKKREKRRFGDTVERQIRQGKKISAWKAKFKSQFKHHSQLMLSSLNCFAGGIFLCTSFIELLPEVRNNFKEYTVAWSRSLPGNDNVR